MFVSAAWTSTTSRWRRGRYRSRARTFSSGGTSYLALWGTRRSDAESIYHICRHSWKSFSILKIHFINVSRTTATGPLLEKKWSHSQRINGVDFSGGAIMSSWWFCIYHWLFVLIISLSINWGPRRLWSCNIELISTSNNSHQPESQHSSQWV